MNETWVKSLRLHFKRLYPFESNIKVEELATAMKLIEGHEKNLFATYAIRSREEDKSNPEDIVSFDQVLNRITATYKDTRDSMYIDAYFHLIDNDQDGFISYADLEQLSSELGAPCMNQSVFLCLTDRFRHDSTKLSKAEFMQIIRQYI